MPEMSLRDYFAAKAMQSIILKGESRDGPTPECDIKRITAVTAVGAYAYADAMLAEQFRKTLEAVKESSH